MVSAAVKHHVYLFGAMIPCWNLISPVSNNFSTTSFESAHHVVLCCVVLTDGIRSELHIPIIQRNVVCQWVQVEVQNVEFLEKTVMSQTVYNRLSSISCLIDGWWIE